MKYRILLLLVALLSSACALTNRNQTTQEEEAEAYDYASGTLTYSVFLNGVGLQVERVDTRPGEDHGIPGYTFVVLTMNVVNESELPVIPPGFALVDQYTNRYVSWQTNVPFGSELTNLPQAVNVDESINGNVVYIVPNAALPADLRLRWDSERHQSRIEVFLGPIFVEE